MCLLCGLWVPILARPVSNMSQHKDDCLIGADKGTMQCGLIMILFPFLSQLCRSLSGV